MGKAIGLGCLAVIVIAAVVLGISAWGTYNGLVTAQQDVEAKWAQVENVYQRRADLIPNLVATVKGYAAHETETLQAVTASRAQVGSIQVTPEILNNPAEFQKFQQAQAGLTGALSRLMVVVERYPDLKANQNFLELQNQLEGTENRISVERMRFNESAQAYNTRVMRFPSNIFARLFGFERKAYFQAAPGSDQAPTVDFSK
ncbi:MAG: LemA family protein [Acidobacteria bacterium]|nr:LemA family protein [Acidobacteriota bacterium]